MKLVVSIVVEPGAPVLISANYVEPGGGRLAVDDVSKVIAVLEAARHLVIQNVDLTPPTVVVPGGYMPPPQIVT